MGTRFRGRTGVSSTFAGKSEQNAPLRLNACSFSLNLAVVRNVLILYQNELSETKKVIGVTYGTIYLSVAGTDLLHQPHCAEEKFINV